MGARARDLFEQGVVGLQHPQQHLCSGDVVDVFWVFSESPIDELHKPINLVFVREPVSVERQGIRGSVGLKIGLIMRFE